MPHITQPANDPASRAASPEKPKPKRRTVGYVWHAATVRAPTAVRNKLKSLSKRVKKPASSDEAETRGPRKRINGAKFDKEMIGPPIPQDASEQLPSPAHDNGRNFPVIEQYSSSPRVPGAQVEVAGRTSGRPGPPAVSTPLRNRVSTFDGRTGPDEITPHRMPYDQHDLGKVREGQSGLRLDPSIPDEPGSPSQDGGKKRYSFGRMWQTQTTQLRTARRQNGLRMNPFKSEDFHNPAQDDGKERSRIESMREVQARTAKKHPGVNDLCQTQMDFTRTARDDQLITGRKPTVASAQAPRKGGSRLRRTNGLMHTWV